MERLEWFHVAGYKSLKNIELGLKNINVLIGPNGGGKSNILSLFSMLSEQVAFPFGRMQEFIARHGGAHVLLHDGPKVTEKIEIDLKFRTDLGFADYTCNLSLAAGDTLIFSKEFFRLTDEQERKNTDFIDLGAGHRESRLIERSDQGDQVAQIVFYQPHLLYAYHFHDTSFSSGIRGKSKITDYGYLKDDGANLGAFLMNLRDTAPDYYRIIVDKIRALAPFFDDFELIDDHGFVLLRWREKGSDQVFDASQASDGLLRAMALIALLGQPSSNMIFDILIIDEPELGLHPYAISVITGMIRNVARERQVIVSTQSVLFIDAFEPEDIVVVERCGRETVCKRLDSKELDAWLGEYSLSELWEKNVLGGRP